MFENLITELKNAAKTLSQGVGQSYNIAQIDVQNPYQEFTYTIPPSEIMQVFYAHSYFRVLEYTGDANTLKVRFGSSGQESVFSGAGLGYAMKEPVDRVDLRNDGTNPLTVKIGLATGVINDDRLSVSGTVTVNGHVIVDSGNINVTGGEINVSARATTGQVAVNAATLISASSATKMSCTINAGSSDLYISFDSGVTTGNGYLIPANGSATITTKDEIYGVRGSGVATCYKIEEFSV